MSRTLTLSRSRGSWAWMTAGLVASLAGCSSTDVTGVDPPPIIAKPQPVVISEVMYHPVDENALVESHEFIELYNPADAAVDLTGWSIAGDVKYVFPAGTSIAARGLRVIAKSKPALASVASYQLDQAELLGDYEGELDNGGGSVRLLDAQGTTVDLMTYSDQFPWPMGADALGADDPWLGRLPTPVAKLPYRYRGRSLERVAAEIPSSEIANWVPSPLEGPSPGRLNSLAGAPPTIVTTKLLRWSGSDVLIRAADSVKVSVTFSSLTPFSSPKLEYFVDDVQVSGEPTTIVDLVSNNGAYEATLPPQPNNAIVRYRILVDQGRGVEVISPRASDPLPYWAYFVSPPVTTSSTLFHLFVKKADWNQLYDNTNFATDDRRVMPGGAATSRCTERPSWDAQVPAVFVYNGVVHDTFVRYQGSRWNRLNGVTMDATRTTINPLPDRPAGPYRVLSWKVDFPDYALLDNKRHKLVLNKMNQACPGLDDGVGELLYGDPSIGVPVQRARYARLHINGGYYHYMLDLEHIDGDLMKRWLPDGEEMGDLFKADGNAGPANREGPWGIADESALTLNPDCPMWTLDDRYEHTYQRITNKWKPISDVRTMIETLNMQRNAAVAANDMTQLRAYLRANFDYQKVIDYIAIRNWAQPWDDSFHNHFLYRRATDGRWLMIPQDKDMEFGEFFGFLTGVSFYIGQQGDPDNRGLFWNVIKDAFLRAFRAEYWARVVELDASGVLSPAVYRSKVTAAAAQFSLADYTASPAAQFVCSYPTELGNLQRFGECRHQDIQDIQAQAACTATTCGLKGSYYQTKAADLTRDFALATLRLTRTDARVAFDWSTNAPGAGVPVDDFQVAWTGSIVPRYTEAYTFHVLADDGVRLYINGTRIIDRWTVNATATEVNGTASLTAGVPVSIRLEYFDATGAASARLSWSSATQCKQIVPTNLLRPL